MSIGNNLISLATKSQRHERSPEVLVSRKLWGRGVCFGGIFFYKHFAPPERGQFEIRDLVVREVI